MNKYNIKIVINNNNKLLYILAELETSWFSSLTIVWFSKETNLILHDVTAECLVVVGCYSVLLAHTFPLLRNAGDGLHNRMASIRHSYLEFEIMILRIREKILSTYCFYEAGSMENEEILRQ